MFVRPGEIWPPATIAEWITEKSDDGENHWWKVYFTWYEIEQNLQQTINCNRKEKKNTLVCTNSLFCKLSRKLSHSILLVYCISPSKGPFTVTNLSVTSDQRPVTSDHWPATSYQWPTSILDSPAFKSLINNLPRYKIFHMWSAFAKNRRIAWKIWSMEDDFAILPTGFGKSWIFQLVAPYDDDLSSSRHDERPS